MFYMSVILSVSNSENTLGLYAKCNNKFVDFFGVIVSICSQLNFLRKNIYLRASDGTNFSTFRIE